MYNKVNPEQLLSEMKRHISTAGNENPALYVTTYHKYAAGLDNGMWVDLTTFDGYDDFVDFCRLLHHDEADPEFMFPDYENMPKELYRESLSRSHWEQKMQPYLELDSEGRQIADAYIELNGFWYGMDLKKALADCMGKFDDEEDFARWEIEECHPGELNGIAEGYFDYAKYARDLFMTDFSFQDGFVFYNR